MKKFSLLLAFLSATAAIMANFRNSRDLPPVNPVALQNIRAKRNDQPWHSEGFWIFAPNNPVQFGIQTHSGNSQISGSLVFVRLPATAGTYKLSGIA